MSDDGECDAGRRCGSGYKTPMRKCEGNIKSRGWFNYLSHVFAPKRQVAQDRAGPERI